MSYTNELYHHGIKGQKWGVRRFQNPDGSRTAAGRKRESVTRKKATAENAEMLATLARSREGTRSDEYREILRKVAQGGADEVFDATAKKTNAYLDGLAKEIETKYEPNLDEYCMYASVGSTRRRGFTDDDKDVQKVFEAYRYDDADQGNENSYTYYMLANGVNPNKFHDDHFKKLNAMRAESKRVARDLLGDHADDVISRYGDWKWTTSDQVAVDLQDLVINDKYYRYEPYARDDGYKYSAAEIQAMKDDITYARENGLVRVKHSDARQNYLMHFGIKGQKWGVRRFQNPDGTRTPEGAARELKRYRKRELRQLDRMNRKQTKKDDKQIAKAQIKMSRAAARGGSLFRKARVTKQQYKLEDLKQKKLYRQGLYASERAKVMRMTIGEMDSEKAGLTKNRGERSVMQMFSKGRLDREFKTGQRVTEEQRQNAYSNAYMMRSAMA